VLKKTNLWERKRRKNEYHLIYTLIRKEGDQKREDNKQRKKTEFQVLERVPLSKKDRCVQGGLTQEKPRQWRQ